MPFNYYHLPAMFIGPKGKEYTVMGWGRTNNVRRDQGDKKEGGAHSNVLQKLQLPDIPVDQCKSKPEWKAFSQITTDKQLCAGAKLRKCYLLYTTLINS